MKQNYIKKINIDYYCLYLPWIIIDSWKSNTSINPSIQLPLLDFWSQFLTSDVIFNCCAYAKQVDQIIFCKFSFVSIRDVAYRGTLPMPQALRPNTNNIYCEANLTKVGFGNAGHCFTTITSLSHSWWALARTQLITFWSFHLCTTMAFPKMQVFILAWYWCRGPLSKVKALPCLVFFATKLCTSFKCLIINHLAQYATMQVPTLHFHFDLTFIHFLSFPAILGGQGGAGG